jgi:SNF2 family DNA or RNA helicase
MQGPRSMVCNEYTIYSVLLLTTISGGVLITDDMGLGKTIQSLVLALKLLKQNPRQPGEGGVLTVVPASAIGVWKMHLDTFFDDINRPNYHIAHRAWTKTQLTFRDLFQYDFVICTTEALRAERAAALKFKSKPGIPIPHMAFLDPLAKWRVFLIDEVHVIRSPNSATHIVACLVSAQFRIGLSGTVFRNRSGDWFSLFEWLRFSPWDVHSWFTRAFASIKAKEGFEKDFSGRPDASNIANWDIAANAISFGRSKSVLKLPPLIEIPVKFTLNPYEKRICMEEWELRKESLEVVLKQMTR